jgi:hypothetical protein
MPEAAEASLNTTTNLVGGQNEGKKVSPQFSCCLVFLLTCSNWLLEPLHFLASNTASMPKRHHAALLAMVVTRRILRIAWKASLTMMKG